MQPRGPSKEDPRQDPILRDAFLRTWGVPSGTFPSTAPRGRQKAKATSCSQEPKESQEPTENRLSSQTLFIKG